MFFPNVNLHMTTSGALLIPAKETRKKYPLKWLITWVNGAHKTQNMNAYNSERNKITEKTEHSSRTIHHQQQVKKSS